MIFNNSLWIPTIKSSFEPTSEYNVEWIDNERGILQIGNFLEMHKNIHKNNLTESYKFSLSSLLYSSSLNAAFTGKSFKEVKKTLKINILRYKNYEKNGRKKLHRQ